MSHHFVLGQSVAETCLGLPTLPSEMIHPKCGLVSATVFAHTKERLDLVFAIYIVLWQYRIIIALTMRRFEKQPHFCVKILLWSKPAMAVTAGGSAPYLAFTYDIIKFDSHFYSFCNVSLKTCKSSLAAF